VVSPYRAAVAQRLVIVGAGGHGREVLDVVEAVGGYDVVGFLDDGEPDETLVGERGLTVFRSLDDVGAAGDIAVVLAIGDPRLRMKVAERLSSTAVADALVHPLASLGSRCRIDAGSVIAAGARLTTNVNVGRHCYIGPNATIGHDAVLLDGATVYPGAVVSGSVTIGRAATIGAGAAVRQGVHIGAAALVALGAGVVRDVPEGTTVAGTPARRLGSR
jgi:sugar O-acyltransferase (sialic acid O-acetyltransferase NeuD family)